MGSVARREELCFAKDPNKTILFLAVVEIHGRFGGEEEDIIAGSNVAKAQTDDFSVLPANNVPLDRTLTDLGANYDAKARCRQSILRHLHPARSIERAQLAFQHAGHVSVFT